LGIDLINNPELAAQPEVAARIATWYWQKRNLGEAARAGDVRAVTKGITGGKIGLAERQALFTANMQMPSLGVTAALPAVKVSKPAPLPVAVPAGQQQKEKTWSPVPVIGQNMTDRGIAHIVTGGLGLKDG
jgi:putative chitinase